MIKDNYTKFEKQILNVMLDNAPHYRDILYEQLSHVNVSREKEKYYSITFLDIARKIKSLPQDGKSGIILEMIIYHDNMFPTDVLLHSQNGYIYELEIYNADSSEIDYDMKIENFDIISKLRNDIG